MKRKQWVLGIMCILLGVIILMGDSSRTQAASQSDRNAYRAVFDATYYYNAYPDVAAACGTDEEALFNHFVSFGVYEGRSASAAFNPQAYRQRYTDLQEAFGNDMAAYCRHYVTFGRAEGRNAAADGQAAVQIKVTIQKKAAPAADDKTSAREDTKKSKTDEAEKNDSKSEEAEKNGTATTKESTSEEVVEDSEDESKTDEAEKNDSKSEEAEKSGTATTKESTSEEVVEDSKDESKTDEAEKSEPATTKESTSEEAVKESKDDSKPVKSESKSAESAKSDSKSAESAKSDSKPAEAAKTDKPEDTQTASVQEADTPSVQTGDAAAEAVKTEESAQSEQSEQNQTAQTIIGTYTTYYEADVSRAVNVELAAQRINGIVVAPDENFSFSNTILDRTTANGYVEGPIFVKGEKSMGIGGGVCQVSSTLYAAMVDAGLPATERHPHSLPVDYLPEGLDATIAGNYMDLKFTNTFSQPLLIQASAEGGKLVVTLTLQ